MNYKITVLGEVMRPGQYTINNERVTILDALGLAGDMTIYGKRNNVLITRENDRITSYNVCYTKLLRARVFIFGKTIGHISLNNIQYFSFGIYMRFP